MHSSSPNLVYLERLYSTLTSKANSAVNQVY